MLNEELNIDLNTSHDTFAPIPAPVAEPVAEDKATDMAYFGSQFIGEGAEGVKKTYSTIKQNLVTEGLDRNLQKLEDKLSFEQSVENRQIISSIIEDPNISKEQKLNILQSYNEDDFIQPDVRKKYAQENAILDNSDVISEQEEQDFIVDNLEQELREAAYVRDANDNDDAWEDVKGELLSLGNVLLSIPGGFIEFGSRVWDAAKQKLTKGTVDWIENSKVIEKMEDGSWAKNVTQWGLRETAREWGVLDDFDTSYTNRALGTVGEGIIFLADKAVEKGIFQNREQALFMTELTATLVPAGVVGTRMVKTSLKHKANGGADVLTRSNPKKAGDELAQAIKSKDSEKIKSMNTKEEIIAAENILPKNGVPDDVVPDIGNRLDRIDDATQLSDKDRIAFETFMDDNISNSKQRFDDRNARVQIIEDSKLHANTASSQIDFVNADTLSGRISFTKTNDYAFSKKKDVVEAAERVEKLVEEANAKEILRDKQLGIDTDPKKIRSSVVVRDVKTKQEFTLDEFKKMKLDNRKFSVDYKFNKKYDFLADSYLGKRLGDSGISILGNKTVASFLNNSKIGEHLFGTGFAAKWFEQSRFAVAGRAGRLKKEVGSEFRTLVSQNKKYRQDIADIIDYQVTKGKDLLTPMEMKMMFPGANEAKLAKLNEIQVAFRKAQDTLFEIQNVAYKAELKRQGFTKGFKQGENLVPVREVGKKYRADFEKGDMKVLDSKSGEYVTLELDVSKLDGIYSVDGRKVMRMDNNSSIHNRKGTEISDYVLVDETSIDMLPPRVLNKMKGYVQKEYKSKLFVERTPKEMIINGKRVDNTTPAGRAVLAQYKETVGTALTRKEADKFKGTWETKPDADKYEYGVRNSSIDDIRDVTDEYRLTSEVYNSTKTRNQDMLVGEDSLLDPLDAFDKAIGRTVNTGAYTQFDKAFKKAFERDFKEVLDGSKGRFPESIDQINPRIAGNADQVKMANEAKALLRRHQHFQGQVNKASDVAVQSGMHLLADVFEKMNLTKIAPTIRNVGDLGATGIQQKAMGVAGTLFITFSSPLRQNIMQPMMFLEQQLIYPKSFNKTMTRTPMHVLGLLHKDSATVRKIYDNYVKSLDPKTRKDFLAEQKAMKDQGILENINQHLAMEETLKPNAVTLKTGGMSTFTTPLKESYDFVKHKVFNKFGFSNGELTNRVGLFLQNKYRWVDDPRNAGKNWADPRNATEIGFEAWKQSGSMTRAGAVGFQRQPVLALMTQFQSINHKAFMNLIQDNATNLTRADRVKLTAVRLVMHGIDLGSPLGTGKYVSDYLRNHEDETVREFADVVTTGIVDHGVKELLNSDVSISSSTSVISPNMYADFYDSVANMMLNIQGHPDAQPLRLASMRALGNLIGKPMDMVNKISNREWNPTLAEDTLLDFLEITSAGNNARKGWLAWKHGQLLTARGGKTGIDVSGWEAIAIGLTGFQTKEQLEQYDLKQKQRGYDQVIFDETSNINKMLESIKFEDVDKALEAARTELSILQESGDIDETQRMKIWSNVIKSQAKAYSEGATEKSKIIRKGYGMNPDEKTRKFMERKGYFESHSDPVVRDIYNFYEKGK